LRTGKSINAQERERESERERERVCDDSAGRDGATTEERGGERPFFVSSVGKNNRDDAVRVC